MELLSFANDLELNRPIMLLAMSGWVDAASIGTDAIEIIADGGDVVAAFEPDELFDYRSSRPILSFTSGELTEISWPRLEIVQRTIDGVDLLIASGNEPDFRWQQLTTEFIELANRYDVSRFVTLGAVPAPVPHTRPVRVVCTTSDPGMLLEGDEVLPNDLVVPGAAVSVLRQGIADAGIPAIGYWVQTPHYIQSPFHPGVLSLLERIGAQVGIEIPIADLAEKASAQLVEIDRDLSERDDAREYVERLEQMQDRQDEQNEPPPVFSFEDIPSPDEIGAEVE
ncbi:MAG: PAC2 family protein, partial [Actinomycetota bacterium]|nr:PAC2 family protein [Actinomycetota bacterium]